MTIQELYEEQIKALPLSERKELMKLIIDDIEPSEATDSEQPDAGRQRVENFVRFLEENGPYEFKYPEIEDPVEWVQKLRADSHRERFGHLYDDDWGYVENTDDKQPG